MLLIYTLYALYANLTGQRCKKYLESVCKNVILSVVLKKEGKITFTPFF